MTRRVLFCCWAFILCLAATADAQSPALTVVNFGPQGEIASLPEANEIRIVFSEPMVALGRIPARPTPPFVRISPAIPGAFRWSGTTILIFTPDPKRPLPYATTYEVTVDTTATAVSGRKVARPVTFRFTTPTVKLLSTAWYRRDGTVNSRMVLLLRFNQPVNGSQIASALNASLAPHEWTAPSFTPEALARLKTIDPASIDRFNAKVNATRQIVRATTPVAVRLTNDWDKKRFPVASDLVAFETTAPVAPESHVKLTLSAAVRSPAGPATPGQPQEYTVEAEPAFFVNGFWCTSQCDADLRNPIRMRGAVRVGEFTRAIAAADITPETGSGRAPSTASGQAGDKAVAKTAKPRRQEDALDYGWGLVLEDAGFEPQPPSHRYAVTLAPDLKSADGQTLGYRWIGIVDNWHMRAFTSFGDGQGVWERSGGAQLPFYARNMVDVTQWAVPVSTNELVPLLVRLREQNFHQSPSGAGIMRKLGGAADRILSHGLDLSKALNGSGSGIVWTSVREGEPIPRSRRISEEQGDRTKSSVVQVTNMGISVKDSPQNTLIFVTRLDTGAPVPNAAVSIIRTPNATFWRGTTDGDGTVLVPNTRLRDPDDDWAAFNFIVTAEVGGDIAYVGSDWNEGITPWEFGTGINLNESDPLLRGSVFTDRGVYKLGEEIHLKAILRHNAPDGIRLLPSNTPVFVSVRDSQNRVVDERTIRVNNWSTAEWTMTLPIDGALGNYSLRAILESDRPKPKAPESLRPGEVGSPERDDYVRGEKAVHGYFLVAAYRRPDFRVDVALTGGAAIAGDPLNGNITARYLFGAPMGTRPVSWKFAKSQSYGAPAAITEKFGDDRWIFVGWGDDEERPVEAGSIRSEEQTLTKDGQLPLKFDTKRDAGVPYVYELEADVEDVSRQHIANRASVVVHPAPWYVGIRRPSYFLEQKSGLKTEIVTVGLDGNPVGGVPVEMTLTQVQWTSVRRAEGNGFYTWDTERKLVPAGKWTVTTAGQPVPLEIPFANGGYFQLVARGRGADGRFAITRTSFYVLGSGYTAWQRFDHNRIELVPERQTYKPGETARIMIQSPWEQATALVTTEREGIRSHRQFPLTSTQQSISIPIGENDIPNVFVSVLLVKGRTVAAASATDVASAKPGADASDPGKPSFRLGYVELKVEDASKRLSVTVAANREEYRPASAANVRVDVKDQQGRGTASEVTLWAVDYGVLSLTSYRTPDILGSVYVRKALQVLNSDSRQRIVSRRVLTPKGSTEGGGGGADASAGTLRKDFRVLAFWLGSVTTGADGHASVDVKLPESLTTYRIMAVAGDRASRFGSGDAEVRTNKPLTLRATFPRFMAVGDRAFFGAVVGSQLKSGGEAVVTMKSLDPGLLELTGPTEQRVKVAPGGNIEVRFQGAAKAIGRARLQMTAKLGDEIDSFEDAIPVEVLASAETVATYGEAGGSATTATETLTVPTGVVPGFGGLHVEVASTALVGLGEGARYLVEYPYGCAEQKGSRAIALLLAADLGDAFSLPGMDTSKMKPAVQQTLKELERFQCPSGGFAYWPGACSSTSPYLTAYLLHVFKVASDLKYDVDAGMRARAHAYLEQQLAAPPPVNEGWWPAYTAWQAFAVKVLTEGGRNQDSNLTRLFGYLNRMPVFAVAYLHDAMVARGETSGARVDELRRRMNNAILPEAGASHVEELADPYLLWFWNSNVRSTAIVLNSLARGGGLQPAPAPETPPSNIRALVRWLMQVRKDGRWGNTQENAYAMEALVNYYRRFEPAAPDFRAVVKLAEKELAREEFRGRTTTSEATTVPMEKVLASAPGGTARPLTFTREGTGTLFYSSRLRYAVDQLFQQGLDSGFAIERRYEPFVEEGSRPAAASYAAGDLVRVTLTFRLSKERRFVAVTDPLPAGFEAVESWFSTTASDMAAQQDRQRNERDTSDGVDWENWFRSGGFDHVERHDDRIQLFATRLSEGVHEFSYVVRATTAGSFRTAPARAEEMYTPEVFGRTATTVIEVKR
jgi:alpha-2-macroglobulin